MHDLPCAHDGPHRTLRVREIRFVPPRVHIGSGHVVEGCLDNHAVRDKVHDSEFGLANPRRVLEHLLKYGLDIIRKHADEFENFGCRTLLIEGFLKIAGFGLHLVEQPRVLDRDHRLVGEVLDKLNLSLSEWSHLLAVDDDRPNQRALLEHWNGEKGSRSCLLDGNDSQGLTFSVCRIGFEIRDMLKLLCANKPTKS